MAKPIPALFATVVYGATCALGATIIQRESVIGNDIARLGIVSTAIGLALYWAVAFALNFVTLLPTGWLLRFVLNKALAGQRSAEPAAFGIPAGVWLAMAATQCAFLAVVATALALELQPWWPSGGNWARTAMATKMLAMGALVVMADCAVRVYGIPPRTTPWRRLVGYFVGPWVVLVGLVVAIIGLLHRQG